MDQARRPDAEELRRRLYRAGASPADLDTYLDRVESPVAAGDPPPAPAPAPAPAPGPAPAPAPEVEPPATAAAVSDRPVRRGRRWPLLVGGAGAVALLAAAAVAVGTLAPEPAPTAAASSAFAGWTAAPRDPGDSLVAGVIDTGRRAHAEGAARQEGPGMLYRVARGDTVGGIAARFGLCTADVIVALPYGADAGAPPPGGRLLLQRSSTAAGC